MANNNIRSAADFFDELQGEIEAIKAGTLGLEEAREISKYRGHQVKVASIASQNMRFALKTRRGEIPLVSDGELTQTAPSSPQK
jgi:hypothetical protein